MITPSGFIDSTNMEETPDEPDTVPVRLRIQTQPLLWEPAGEAASARPASLLLTPATTSSRQAD